MRTVNFQMFKQGLEKAEEPEIKLPTSAGSWKKQESSRKTSSSALLTMPKPLTVWITINCGKFWEIGIPDHLTCLLRNLYAGQEATVRTGHGYKTDRDFPGLKSQRGEWWITSIDREMSDGNFYTLFSSILQVYKSLKYLWYKKKKKELDMEQQTGCK